MLKKFKLLSFWTIGYTLFVTIFFFILFNFNIWSLSWIGIKPAAIRGFDGFVFVVSFLAIIPVYISTARYVWKTQKFPYSVPKFQLKKKKSEKKEETPPLVDEPEKHLFPPELPDELRAPYIRAKTSLLSKNSVNFSNIQMSEISDVQVPDDNPAPETMMPLPESFDEGSEPSIPVFKDISFGSESESVSAPDNSQITIKDDTATFVFDDPDFWVADDENDWFATGKQIESPIKLLLSANVTKRILVLKERNIMNIDNLIPKWEEQGITVESVNESN